MITTEEIKKELDAGRDVELECIDTEGFLGKESNTYLGWKKVILSLDRIIATSRSYNDDASMLKDARGTCITDSQLKYFRIKRPAPTLRDLTIGDKVFIREDLEDEKEYEFGLYFFKDSMPTGEQIISDVCGEGINIEGDDSNRYSHGMIDWEKTAELNAKKAPTFDDLIDVAVQAKKDGVISSQLTIMSNGIHFFNDNERTSCSFYSCNPSAAKTGIEFIKSLYTETFVIEQYSDTRKMISGAKAILTNGEEVVFSNRTGADNSLWFDYNGCHTAIIPFIALKGATVTQKRGAQ